MARDARSAALSEPPTLAAFSEPATRNGFRFLLWDRQYGGCKWCSTLPSILSYEAVSPRPADECLVAVLQVNEVGGGDPREMLDFGGAFVAEIEG